MPVTRSLHTVPMTDITLCGLPRTAVCLLKPNDTVSKYKAAHIACAVYSLEGREAGTTPHLCVCARE